MPIEASVCQEMVVAATRKAQSIGALVSAAVVDGGGNLVSFLRMDGAEIAGPTLAVDKAYTAVSNRISTQELSVLAAPGGPLFGLHSNGGGRFVIFGGGIPIFDDSGLVLGAVGVSGGAVEEDVACAEAAIARWNESAND